MDSHQLPMETSSAMDLDQHPVEISTSSSTVDLNQHPVEVSTSSSTVNLNQHPVEISTSSSTVDLNQHPVEISTSSSTVDLNQHSVEISTSSSNVDLNQHPVEISTSSSTVDLNQHPVEISTSLYTVDLNQNPVEISTSSSTVDLNEHPVEISTSSSTVGLNQHPVEILTSLSTVDLNQHPLEISESSTMGLLALPELVLDYLISNYLQKDKLNLACSSWDYCNYLAYIIWQEVFIPWTDLFSHKSLSESLKENLKYVSTLNIVNRTSHPLLSIRETYKNSHPFSSPMETWKKVVENYQIILDNTTKVRKATIRDMLTDDGIGYLCEKLKNLREVTFIDCTEISVSGWEQLVSLENLEKLTLKNCFIRNTGIEMLVNMKSLKELHLNVDWKDNLYITRNALKHISSMKKLKKLTISCSYELELSKRDLRCLKILPKLEELSFEQTLVDDDALAYLVQNAKVLESLNLSGCHEITERGLMELVNLPSLRKVNLQEITAVPDTSFSLFSTKTGMKEMSEPHTRIFTKGK